MIGWIYTIDKRVRWCLNMFVIKVYKENELDSVGKAFKEGSMFWKWGMDSKFKNVSKTETEKQLVILKNNIGTNKYLQLIDSPRVNIPNDAYVDLAYKPTYVAAGVYICAYNKYPELFVNKDYLNTMCVLLNSSLGRDLLDHGYEAEYGRLQNLLFFAKAGVKQFVTKHPEECNEFCSFIKLLYEKLATEVNECHSKGETYSVNGFGRIIADEDAMDVLKTYNNDD